jgi:glyoxylase-like metal-dependent hydrolase (beta-lactamase superfamily II)
MQRGFVLGALVIVGGLSAALGATEPARQAPGQQPSASALQVDKIRDNLYVLRGGGGNSAVFVTATGVVLVDTKLPGWGKPILEKIKELTDKPVATIINTHTHFDHVSGNVDVPPSVDIVTHENTARLMREMQPPVGYPDAPRTMFEDSKGVGLPKHTFKDEMTIGSGTDRVELHYFGRAHTGGDAFVVFPTLRVMHTGDVFPVKGMPIMDANNGGSGIEYPATLAKAAALQNIDVVITGHNATTLTMADLKTFTEFIGNFVEAVKSGKSAGKTLDEVASSWKVPSRFLEAGYVQPGSGANDQNAARMRQNAEFIWKELK